MTGNRSRMLLAFALGYWLGTRRITWRAVIVPPSPRPEGINPVRENAWLN